MATESLNQGAWQGDDTLTLVSLNQGAWQGTHDAATTSSWFLLANKNELYNFQTINGMG